jgi:hypothetical protein
LLTVTLTSGKSRATLDATCAEAVDVARAALDIVAPEGVGAHLGVEPDAERVVLHYFESKLPGYRGWRWAVTVMRASRSKTVTVGETVLLPGSDALLPPAWVPWTERLRPGDLGVGDLLPTDEEDDRLEPGWNATDEASAIDDGVAEPEYADTGFADDGLDDAGFAEPDEVDVENVAVDRLAALEVAVELDLLRSRVLSPIGLDDAVDRWAAGDHGPDAPMAMSAPSTCATCGFRIALRGRLGQAFGICANEISPSDGHIVTIDHGCGAHSEAVVVPTMAERTEPFIDDVIFEVVVRDPAEAIETDATETDATEAEAIETKAADTEATADDVTDASTSEPASG